MHLVDSDLHNHFLMIDNEKRELVKEHIWYEVRIMLVRYKDNVGLDCKYFLSPVMLSIMI